MAYNIIIINKMQVGKFGGIKNLFFSFILAIFSIVIISNVYNQFEILINAKIKNKELDNKIKILEESNYVLQKKIEYATTSAFLKREVMKELGMGKFGDFWLKIDKKDENIDLFPKYEETDNSNNFIKWIRLFTQ